MPGGICGRLTRLDPIWREARHKAEVALRARGLLVSMIAPLSAIHTGIPEPTSERQSDSGGFLRQEADISTYSCQECGFGIADSGIDFG
jgi:hypothetical protein